MRVLVYPAMMEIGGSQSNAIELAAAVRDLGHEVIMFGPEGVLVDVVKRMQLEYVVSPRERTWPSLRNMAALTELVHSRSIDVVHGYEWGPALDLAFGPHLRLATPLVMTVMSMDVPEFLPRHCHLVVGTAQLAAEQSASRPRVSLMEPPIDTMHNSPDGRLAAQARKRFGFDEGEVVISVVCRLVPDLEKLQGVLEALRVIGDLAQTYPVRFVVVGDGEGLAEVRCAADEINGRLGRVVVVVTGGLLDPRDAYRAADVVIGMGSSALKALAFEKPLVVQGSAGFWRRLDPDSLPTFLDQGWYGEGGTGEAALRLELKTLVADPVLRARLGEFGLEVVRHRYGLESASRVLVQIYGDALAERPSHRAVMTSLARSGPDLGKFKAAIARHHWRTEQRVNRTRPGAMEVAAHGH